MRFKGEIGTYLCVCDQLDLFIPVGTTVMIVLAFKL